MRGYPAGPRLPCLRVARPHRQAGNVVDPTGPRYHLVLTCALLLALFLLPGCYGVGEPVTVGDQTSVAHRNRFGYVAVGPVVNAQFFGDIHGVGPGTGVTIYVPPLAAVETFVAIGAATAMSLPFAVIESGGAGGGQLTAGVFEGVFDGMTEAMNTREHSRSGFEGALSEITRDVVSDLSFDLAFSFTTHEDLDRGGWLHYNAILLGVRAAGARHHVPRVYATGGIGWFFLSYDNRPNAYVFGPYAGLGAELFDSTRRRSLGLEYSAHFFFGDDQAGDPVEGGMGQVSLLVTWYW